MSCEKNKYFITRFHRGDHAVLLEENRYCLDITIVIDSDRGHC